MCGSSAWIMFRVTASNFEVVSRFLENLCTPVITISYQRFIPTNTNLGPFTTLKIQVVFDIVPCRLVNNRRFGDWCLRMLGLVSASTIWVWTGQTLNMEAASTSKYSVTVYTRTRRHIPKNLIFNTAVRTSNLALPLLCFVWLNRCNHTNPQEQNQRNDIQWYLT